MACATAPASQSPPGLRIRSPLVQPSLRISRTRLSLEVMPSLTGSWASAHSVVRSRSPSTACPPGIVRVSRSALGTSGFPLQGRPPMVGSTATEGPKPRYRIGPDTSALIHQPTRYRREEKTRTAGLGDSDRHQGAQIRDQSIVQALARDLPVGSVAIAPAFAGLRTPTHTDSARPRVTG